MYTRTSSFPAINYLLTFLMMGWVGYRTYAIFTTSHVVMSYLFFAVSFFAVIGVQVLLLALSMGKTDKNQDINYGPIVLFNKIILVLYAIFIVAFHVLLILKVFKVINI